MQVTKVLGVVCVLSLFAACPSPHVDGDRDKGYLDEVLTPADRVSFPGLDHADGRRIQRVSGFSEEVPILYWFLGFGSRRTVDAFFFCREGDEACPLDEHRRLNWDTLVGHPIFTRIPGDPEFSPFWQMWVVRVPDDFEPDSVKTIETLDRLAQAEALTADRFILDFGTLMGDWVGPREVVLHCALVLRGTGLDSEDGMMPDGTGPILEPPLKFGWFNGHRIDFLDFSVTDGVFPAAEDSESRALMPLANVYIMWRRCDPEAPSEVCSLPGYWYANRRPISERGLGQDITGDRDDVDTNNVFGSFQCSRQRATEKRYSPLWGPQAVMLAPDNDAALIDTFHDQRQSEVQSADDVFRGISEDEFPTPTVMMEDETGNPVPGNEGRVFFNCPFPIPQGSVPYPCEGDSP